jgi:hypothetical protein
MSYTVSAYLVNLDSVHKVLGSGNCDLLREISIAQGDTIARRNREFKQEIEGGAPPLEHALRQLIDGARLTGAHAFQYWYAVELIAAHAGQPLDLPGLASVDCSYLDEVGGLLGTAFPISPHHLFPRLLERWPSFGLPAPHDFPVVGFLRAAECAEVAKPLGTADLEDLEADGEILEGVEDYAKMILAAVAADSDLLIFYY